MDERTGMHVERGSSLDACLMEIIGSSAAETRARQSISVLSSEKIDAIVDKGNFADYFSKNLKYQFILF